MAAELVTKRGQYFVGEVVLAAGAEAFEQRGTKDWSRNRLVDGGIKSPPAFPGIGDAARELRQVRVIEQRLGCQIQKPRRDHTAATPNLGHVRQIDVVLIMFRIAQRRRFSIDGRAYLSRRWRAAECSAPRRKRP